jgi:hypothetical protein
MRWADGPIEGPRNAESPHRCRKEHGVKPDWALQITERTSAVAAPYGAHATAVKTNGCWPKEGGRPVFRGS